jgi:hypothetical protein
MTVQPTAKSGDLVRFKSRLNRTPEQRKRHGRSRVSNGADVLPNTDGRSLVCRRFRDISNAILADQQGVAISEARLQLIRRFAAAAVIAEQLESDLANGKAIDVTQHALLCSTLVRVARQIGIARVAKDVTPSLAQILAEDGHAEH